jgi:UDP-glucose 4-epimerase
MRILVAGGAGYIGSHAVRYLKNSGHQVWVYDNLGIGHKAAVAKEELIVGDLADRPKLTAALRDNGIEAVMHFAAFALVGESVVDPAKYYLNNVCATIEVLEAMRAAGVMKLVFSSTTATYGTPEKMPITESTPQAPINPYGFSKLVVERAMDDYAAAYGLAGVALRYFNAAGAAPGGDIGEDHRQESHLIPIVLQVANGQRKAITIFGDDYPTPDGTCIRDYIHVDDLAAAHEMSLHKLTPGKVLKMNLGTGRGYSVREVIDACRKATGKEIPIEIGPRRPGDPPELVADNTLACSTLGWKPKYDTIESIVESAWNWHKSHPQGYATVPPPPRTTTGRVKSKWPTVSELI